MMYSNITTTLSDKLLNDDVVSEYDNDVSRNILIVKTALYSFIFTLGVFGNILVIKATTKYITLRRPTNILICNLCVCDVLIMLIGILMFVVGEKLIVETFGVNVCRVLQPMLVGFLTATVFTLMTIAIERCDVIVNSVRAKLDLTMQKALYIVFGIDTSAIVLSAPLAFSDYKENPLQCERDWTPTTNMVYGVTLFLVQYVIPLFVMSLLYSLCWHRIRKKNKTTIAISANNRTPLRDRSKSEGDALKVHTPIENKTFFSGSNNHLAGLATKRRSIRRSFSADSVYDINTSSNKRNSKRHSVYRKSMTYDTMPNVSTLKERPASFCGSSRGSISRNNSLMLSRASLRGSVQKIQQSLTSLIIGTDGVDALTAFAAKRMKQTLKTLKVFSCILVIFAFCMLPHHIVELMHANYYRDHSNHLFSFLHLFIYINAAINPWIYAGMNKSYRLAYRAIFRKKKSVSRLLRNNLFRTNSGTVILTEKHSKARVICITKFLRPLCGKYFNTLKEDDLEETEALNERRDTVKSLDGDFFRVRTRSRKDSGRSSRKESNTIPVNEIPILAPIIIITCYDDEIACEEAFNSSF